MREVLLLEAEKLNGFKLEQGGGRRFMKDVLRVGSWVHPTTGQKIDFDRPELERLARDTNEWIALGNKVYFPDGHTSSALANLGTWSSFAVDGDVLRALVDVADDEAARKVGKTITDVSPAIEPNVRASTGQSFKSVIIHVAATPEPVIPGQANFVRLARTSQDDDDEESDNLLELEWSDAAREAAAETRRAHANHLAGDVKNDGIAKTVGSAVDVRHETGAGSHKVHIHGPVGVQPVHRNLEAQGFQRAGTPKQARAGKVWKHPNGTIARVSAKGTFDKGGVTTAEFKSSKGASLARSEPGAVTGLSQNKGLKNGPQETTMSKALSLTKQLLGLPEDASEDAVCAKLATAKLAFTDPKNAAEDDAEDAKDKGKDESDEMMSKKLSRELDETKKQVKALEEDRAKRIKKAAEEKVALARRRSVELGVPLEDDVAKDAIALLSRDDDESQRLGDRILKLAHDRATAKPIYSRELENPGRKLETEEPNPVLLAAGYKPKKDEKGRIQGYAR
jgi:hypothetical protein